MRRNHRMHRGKLDSSSLEERLKQAVSRHREVEETYRETQQRFWTILFIDVSGSAKAVWQKGEEFANKIFEGYQTRVRDLLDEKGACFIEPGGGPQVVCCFENPEDAIHAAKSIVQGVAKWNREQKENYGLLPAVGMHQGYIVYHDGTIHQSNTNNMAKRIQTEASPGHIFVSSAIYETLKEESFCEFEFVKTARLKNIPEPEDIYQVSFPLDLEEESSEEAITKPRHVFPSQEGNEEKEEETRIEYLVVIYIDVCESTKKFWSYGDREASELIKEYQKVCHSMFKSCGCLLSQSCEGDQIIAAFDPMVADNAVMSAIKILQFLFRRNTHVPGYKQVRAAIGMHFGEVGLKENAFASTRDMRVGKEIQSLATADEILLSRETVELLSFDLQKYVDHYEICEFKGIPEEYEIFSINWVRTPVRIKSSPFKSRS